MGNQLFPLLKAFVFGELNNLPVVVRDYNQFKIGPYLRNERSKRNYTKYFTFQKSLLGELIDKVKGKSYDKYTLVAEPPLEILPANNENIRYLFTDTPHWSDYFYQLKEHRPRVIKILHNLLDPEIRKKLSSLDIPCIGVHIRMGDFRKLRQGEDFKKVGAVRTPEEYFIDVIHRLREIHGTELPVAVFTDGYENELTSLFKIGNIKMVKGNPDIVDLLLLSRSRVIVTSAGSTFSYWAGFLSDAPLIMHPDHIHNSIRPAELGNEIYEGPISLSPVLIDNIKSIDLNERAN